MNQASMRALWVLLACVACRVPPAAHAPRPTTPDPAATAQDLPARSATERGATPSADATTAPPLRLSWLPEDTKAVARLQAGPLDAPALRRALNTPPASQQRSLPLSTLLTLQSLGASGLWGPPRPQRPVAIVWDAKQRAFWLWNQDDLSVAARQRLERELHSEVRYEVPYWIFTPTGGNLEYFVHDRARWLVACPRRQAPELRAWLREISVRDLGRLGWAPQAKPNERLTLRWVTPQVLESAPPGEVPVLGELRWTPGLGLRINGAPRDRP